MGRFWAGAEVKAFPLHLVVLLNAVVRTLSQLLFSQYSPGFRQASHQWFQYANVSQHFSNECFPYAHASRTRGLYSHARMSRVCHSGGPEEAYGVQGILDAYMAALNNVQLAGPTLFTEVLQTAMARANRPASQIDQRYDVLLILTDGIINDMQQVCVCS